MKISKTILVAPVYEFQVGFDYDEIEHIYALLEKDRIENNVDGGLSSEMAFDLKSFIY